MVFLFIKLSLTKDVFCFNKELSISWVHQQSSVYKHAASTKSKWALLIGVDMRSPGHETEIQSNLSIVDTYGS